MSQERPFRMRVKPVWRDMDALRHVNNAVYLTYLENAREAYWRAFAGDVEIFPFTLARVEIDYRSSATWRDDLAVAVWVKRLGTTSFELEYTIDAADGRRCAEARTVLVMMDPGHAKPVPIDDALRQRWEAFESAPPEPA